MTQDNRIRLALPTGRLQKAVLELLADAGLNIQPAGSNYRPAASDPRFEIKMLKAANIPSLIELGAHDLGFTGYDWVSESSADVVQVFDTGILPVRIVAAAPVGFDPFTQVQGRPLVVASEYENLTRAFMDRHGQDYRYVRTFGATEVFPPEDADLIVDNTATGSALRANRLEIIDTLLESTLLCVANHKAIQQDATRTIIEELQLLMQSVLDARIRVLLEMNVSHADLDAVIKLLPAMKAATVQPLYGDGSFAVRAAVPRDAVSLLIPRLRLAGASDILQTRLERVVI